jgi:hypothetical protein
MAQGVGPEFKSQYGTKTKEMKTKLDLENLVKMYKRNK